MWESAYYIGWVDGGRERSNFFYGQVVVDIDPPLSYYLSFSLNSWTQYIAFNY